MKKLIGGPLDGGEVEDTGSENVAIYYTKTRLAHYAKRDDGHYSFVQTFDQNEAHATGDTK